MQERFGPDGRCGPKKRCYVAKPCKMSSDCSRDYICRAPGIIDAKKEAVKEVFDMIKKRRVMKQHIKKARKAMLKGKGFRALHIATLDVPESRK